MELWDTHTFQHLGTLGRHSGSVSRVALCSEGRILISTTATATGEFSVWDFVSGTLQVFILSGRDYIKMFRIPVFGPGSMRLATWSTRATAGIWEARTGTTQLLIGRGDAMVYESGSFSLDRDGRLLATQLASGTVKI